MLLSLNPSQTWGVGSSPASGFLWPEKGVEKTPLIFGVPGQKGQPPLPTLPPPDLSAARITCGGGCWGHRTRALVFGIPRVHRAHPASPRRGAPSPVLPPALCGLSSPRGQGEEPSTSSCTVLPIPGASVCEAGAVTFCPVSWWPVNPPPLGSSFSLPVLLGKEERKCRYRGIQLCRPHLKL